MYKGKKVIGIICECNPYHAGHTRLLNKAKKYGDILVAIMSGNFVERGEPAVYDKYQRTKKLLSHGVDLVIELPIEYSLSSAKYFARAGIYILNKLKIVDYIIFGSKIANIQKLQQIANINIDKDNIELNLKLKNNLKNGLSYPSALADTIGINLTPNDILAVEYIRALSELNSKITPISIKRKNDLPTASMLRKKIKKKITCDSFSDILNYKLFFASENNMDLSNISTSNNDLSNAMLNTAHINLTFEKRAKLLNTKNRTLANIKRTFFNTIFDIDKNYLKSQKYGFNQKYIRILGIKKEVLPLLNDIKLPHLLSYANNSYKNFVKKFPKKILYSKSLKLNIYASNLYYLLASENMIEASFPCVFS